MPQAEELTIKRAQKGSQAALEELIFAYEKKVYNISFRYMGNEADAFDMAQETLIKIYQRIGKFKGQSSFSSWVYRITVNTCLDGLRKRKKNVISFESAAENGMAFVDERAATPEARALSIEKAEDIQKAIDTLNDDHKSVIILRDVNGLSYEEISQALSISVGTVKSRINRGRQKLRQLLVYESF